jgi:plastocyanin
LAAEVVTKVERRRELKLEPCHADFNLVRIRTARAREEGVRRVVWGFASLVWLASVAAAGSVSGKVVGWSSGDSSAPRFGVIWLEGGRSGPPPTANVVMAQRGGRFVPSFVVAVVGQGVEMPNEDEVAHNVYSLSPQHEFNLGLYAKGEHKVVTFDRPGLVEVGCSIHTFMQGKILVVPSSFYSFVDASGGYHIRDVPAGRYFLRFWGDGFAPTSVAIAVTATGFELILAPSEVRK